MSALLASGEPALPPHSLRLQLTACIGISIITRIIIIISLVSSSVEMSASLNLLLRLFIPPIDLLSPLWATAFLYANKDTNGSVDTLLWFYLVTHTSRLSEV